MPYSGWGPHPGCQPRHGHSTRSLLRDRAHAMRLTRPAHARDDAPLRHGLCCVGQHRASSDWVMPASHPPPECFRDP
jgi:hypothetical protein